jgi:light-regulated signal transduction histidine kinase (bacteriophytochrome)
LIGNRKYYNGFVELFDAGGREVGDIVVTKDVTKDKAAIRQLTVILIVICTPICIGLLGILKLYIRLIESKVTTAYSDLQDAIEKRKLAEDELHRSYSRIEQEVKERTAELQIANEQLTQEIAERKKAEEALVSLNKSLESTVQSLTKANQQLADFVNIVSHDLKAPLRAMGTLADWIATDYADKFDDEGRGKVRLLVGRAERMSKLLDSITIYSEAGHVRQTAEKVDLNFLLAEVIDKINPPENIEIAIENELPILIREKTSITQIFQNLLSNAIKYMDKPVGLITVNCVEEDAFWRFSVADNGPGIEKEYFGKIFKMFQTLLSRDRCESIGIGLAIVKKIVEVYGGNVWVESKVGEGSTFFFTLPKQESEVIEHAQLQANIAR